MPDFLKQRPARQAKGETIMTKRIKTNYPNIYKYETKKGTRYQVRRAYVINGVPGEFDKSGFKTIMAARAKLREIEEFIEKEEFGMISNPNITLDEYYQKYKEKRIVRKEWTADSLSSLDSHYRNHLSNRFGKTPLKKIDRHNYELYLNEMLHDEGLAEESVKTYHHLMCAIMNDAVRCGVLERNRLSYVKIRKEGAKPKTKNIDIENYNLFMDKAKEILTKQHYAMLYLTTFGLRRGEIMGLTQKNVVFRPDGTFIRVLLTRTLKRPDGKGTKTPSSERMIALNEDAAAMLEYCIQEARDIKADFGQILNQEDFIFLNPKRGVPYCVTHLNRIMSYVSEETGVKASPHMMRHTFTTQAALAGVNGRALADYLGHKKTSMTEHYTHATEEGSQKVIRIASTRMHG